MTDWAKRAEDSGRRCAEEAWKHRDTLPDTVRAEKGVEVLVVMEAAMKRMGCSRDHIETCRELFHTAFADRFYDLSLGADQ